MVARERLTEPSVTIESPSETEEFLKFPCFFKSQWYNNNNIYYYFKTYITVAKLSEILELSLLRTKRAAFRSCSVSLYEKQSEQGRFFLSIYLCD